MDYVSGIEPSAITLPELKEDAKPQDGAFGGIPSFCTVTAGETCDVFEASGLWGIQSYVWAWMNDGGGEEDVGTGWPGVSATLLGTADNGNKVFKWTSVKTTAPDYIIFSGGGSQTADLAFQNGGYYNKDGLKATVTPSSIESVAISSQQTGQCYDLQGRRVNPADLKAGIYIKNGRKIIVR